LFSIPSCKVGISIKSKALKDLGPGEQFGEVALLKKGATRAATVGRCRLTLSNPP